jgi:hypothetical protein
MSKPKIRKMTLAVVAGAALSMVAPAVAGAATIHVFTDGYVSAKVARTFERAAGKVANGALRYEWGSPHVSWNRHYGSMALYFVDLRTIHEYCGHTAAACHRVIGNQPTALVDPRSADIGGVPWTVAASHEVFEMLVDPWTDAITAWPDGSGNAWMTEVADPVQNHWTRFQGVPISDFVFPAWFENTTGQQDWMGWLDDSTAGTGTYETYGGYAKYYDPYGNVVMAMRHKIRRVHVPRAVQSRLKGFALARVRPAH